MKTHTTREGVTLLLSEMTDSHLLNTMNLFIRQLATARLVLQKSDTVEPNEYLDILEGRSGLFSREIAISIVRKFEEKFAYYYFEAAVRALPLNDIIGRYRVLINRSSSINPGLFSKVDSLIDLAEEDRW